MHRETVAVIKMREVEAQLESLGLDTETNDPAKFQALIRADHARWGKLIREAGIKE